MTDQSRPPHDDSGPAPSEPGYGGTSDSGGYDQPRYPDAQSEQPRQDGVQHDQQQAQYGGQYQQPQQSAGDRYGQPQYGQPQYGQPQYGQPQYGQPAYPAYQKTNTLSIVAIILGFVAAPGGIICGHIALGQIKRTGENGRPLALTGLIAGYVITGLYVLGFLFYLVAILAVIGGVAGSSSSGFSS